jgi:hypothetical protein
MVHRNPAQMSFDDLDPDDHTFGEGECSWLIPTPLGTHPTVLWGRPYLVGQPFGRLTVIALAGSRQKKNGDKIRYWKCLCECGNEVDVPTAPLRNGNTQSCGCLHLETVTRNGYGTSHGLTGTPTYQSWVSMRQRCRESIRYIDRITVDPRWDDFTVFLADMGVRPAGTTLDRIDFQGPYSPENCRWATATEQIRNRSNSRSATFDGRTQSLVQWAAEFNMPYNRLFDRLGRGWDIARALTTPVRGS